ECVELAAGCTPWDVLEWTRLCVDVDEIEERLQEMAVVEVPVPALRRLPFVLFGRRRVPHVHVLELRPQPEIRVGDVEQPRIDPKPKPWVVEPERHAVRVLPDDELLAGTPLERGSAALGLLRKTGLGVGAKARAVRIDLGPDLRIGHEI